MGCRNGVHSKALKDVNTTNAANAEQGNQQVSSLAKVPNKPDSPKIEVPKLALNKVSALNKKIYKFPADFFIHVPKEEEWLSAFDVDLRLRGSALRLANFWIAQGARHGNVLRAVNDVSVQDLADEFSRYKTLPPAKGPVKLLLSQPCPFHYDEVDVLDDSIPNERSLPKNGQNYPSRWFHCFSCQGSKTKQQIHYMEGFHITDAQSFFRPQPAMGELETRAGRKECGSDCCNDTRFEVFLGDQSVTQEHVFEEALTRVVHCQATVACIDEPIQAWSNGSMYQGQWSNGFPQGVGRVVHSNGNMYEGQWQRGLANGDGAYWWSNGDFYRGQWENDEPSGMGVEHLHGGATYEGEFSKGFKDGSGTFISEDEIYRGQFLKDKYHGYGTLWTHHEGCRNGYFVEGKFCGQTRPVVATKETKVFGARLVTAIKRKADDRDHEDGVLDDGGGD